MILYAQVKGIGTRLKGTGQIFLDRSRAARRHLGLQKQEHILGTLELGYPAVEFVNKVEGKTLGIQWNQGGLADAHRHTRDAGTGALEAIHNAINRKG